MVGSGVNVVRDKSYAFAVKIVRLARMLRRQREYDLASQIVRAGTSIGANVEEAQAGISRADFIAKMSIASKECRESHFWLRLLRDTGSVPEETVQPLIADATELVRILTAIVKTGQGKP